MALNAEKIKETEDTVAENYFDRLDKSFQAYLGQATLGISPAAMMTVYFSWLTQLTQSPGRMLELAFYSVIHWREKSNKNSPATDHRFKSENWKQFPWYLYAENFSRAEDWWQRATTNVPGLPRHVERTTSFIVQQMLDMMSPSNFIVTSPDLFYKTIQTDGRNLVYGTGIALDDMRQKIMNKPIPNLKKFEVGKNMAVTPGRVVFRNHLIELIQYEPQTRTVYKEPILILPAWIMKYYILDLSPNNSLVNWLVRQGHTVFMVSWRNPDKTDRNLSMDDYYRLGAMSSIDAVSAIMPKVGIHLMGYCLGGTLALIAAAAMVGDGDKRLKSLTTLAAQGDFTEAGELLLFITESEISFLKSMMWGKGYLDGKQMERTFQMLHSKDLLWSQMVHDYMMDKRRDPIDLIAWNSDTTRMAYKMHSEYLEKLFLHNDFFEGRFMVEEKLVSPENINLPIFSVSTDKDNVAPWRSVYKIHLMTNTEVTLILTSGGHNAGIVSEPGHEDRSYYIRERTRGTPYIGPDRWMEIAEQKEGSWWPAWHDWLVQRSIKGKISPPAIEQDLCAAPGTYVFQK